MKILFITDAGNTTGIGGHLYSVQALVEALVAQVECVVVSVGSATSPALEALNCRKYKLVFGKDFSRRRALMQFMNIVSMEKPDVIHTFDTITCAFARLASLVHGCGLVHTVCGGPNPDGPFPWSYFPKVRNLIVFSEENEKYFKEKRCFRKTRIWRIPNRINEVEPDQGKISALRKRLNPAVPVILRIGRLSPEYEKTAQKSIWLVKRLAADGVPAQLVFVGAVQDVATEKTIIEALGSHGLVISDPEFVARASAILDIGDLIIGTGRGLMEASACSRVVLVPARSGSLPTLVNEQNWASLFSANFSERSEIKPWDEEQNYADIRKALKDTEYRQRLSLFSRKLYEEHFSLKQVLAQYVTIYAGARSPGNWQIIDVAKHWLWMVWRTKNRLSVSPHAQNPAI